MISERCRSRSVFARKRGEAARINGNKERDLNQIKSLPIKSTGNPGEADAKATEIYALAYAQSLSLQSL